MTIVVGALLAATVMDVALAQNYPPAGAGIARTPHDSRLWQPGGQTQLCVMCHAPHTARTEGALWNRTMSSPAYALYGLSSITDVPSQPGAVSRVCLSCHDGTLGVDAFRNVAGSFRPDTSTASAGSTLSSGHPYGITYDTTFAIRDQSLADPETTLVTVGASTSAHKSGTVASMMLVGGKIECTSCHDVHNRYTAGSNAKGLVKVSLEHSSLCLKCHTK